MPAQKNMTTKEPALTAFKTRRATGTYVAQTPWLNRMERPNG